MPDKGHPLDERAGRPHHPVEPPEVVVAPGVAGREPPAPVVAGSGPDEPLSARPDQRMDGVAEPELRERLGLAGPRPEAGTPEQALSVLAPERALIDGNPHPERCIGSDLRAATTVRGRGMEGFR